MAEVNRHSVSYVLISGNSQVEAWAAVERMLISRPGCVKMADFESPGEALEIGLGRQLCPDLVICHQRHPLEFSPGDVTELIGLLPDARILCCYGSWCVSDGRTSDVWPVTCRVPLDSAAVLLDGLLSTLQNETAAAKPGSSAWPHPALSPLAAAEDVFAWRTELVRPGRRSSLPGWRSRVVLRIADVSLRKTVAELCREAGFEPVLEPAGSTPVREEPAGLVILDADDDPLQAPRAANPGDDVRVIGITGFPGETHRSRRASCMIPKTELGFALAAAMKDGVPEHRSHPAQPG